VIEIAFSEAWSVTGRDESHHTALKRRAVCVLRIDIGSEYLLKEKSVALFTVPDFLLKLPTSEQCTSSIGELLCVLGR
jgi:hypothetical protein